MITGALKSVLGISSPSTVLRDQIGANLASGWAREQRDAALAGQKELDELLGMLED